MVLEGVQRLLQGGDDMWRTLRMIDDYCENEIARAKNGKAENKLDIPEAGIKCEAVACEVKECAN